MRSFVVVAQTGNLTLAAKQLCTTPPAISAHIKALELELKTPLFNRSSKGMALTTKGQLLLEKAQKTLDAAVELVNVAVDNQGEVIGQFKLAVNQNPNQLQIADLYKNIQENCPGISLTIHELATGQAIELIREGRIDGGYIYGELPDDMYGITVKQQHVTTIAPINTNVDEDDKLIEISQQAWITMGSYCPFDDVLQAKLKHFNKANVHTNSDLSRLALVEAGHGLSFLEYEQALISSRQQTIKIIPQLDFDIALHFVVIKQKQNEPLIKAMLQEIRILWQLSL